MTKTQYEKLNSFSDELITAETLQSKVDRTLLYGYTCDRRIFHVYLKDEVIHTVTYDLDYLEDGTSRPVDMKEVSVSYNCHYVPGKRVYPHKCDFEFCKALLLAGVSIPFTFWEDVEESVYYGFIMEGE